eukprot:CAMPEP_0170381586 /NCGR_PEP_ID=MMETSP0117_2-20130122/14490_1 /TAXON_ID=400756 /ORGANISM="Durinskia baltica, Strain CSIRO CS-38" /LENGTH=360 /DNA_ID=CAMNT_0010637171 /DNA_START=330 /DNA_END=1412 /DNA_ORIENTATION=+
MITPTQTRKPLKVSPNTKRHDLFIIQKSEQELKNFLVEREFDEDGIDDYLEQLTTKEWRRLMSLFRGDIPMSFTFDAAFQNFTSHCPAWLDISKRTFLFDTYGAHEQMKVLRVQTTDICSAHADVVLVHLEKCIRAGPTCTLLMPDLTALLCRIYSKEGFKQKFINEYVNGKHRLSAVNFLRSVYGITSDQMDTIQLNVPTSPDMAKRLLKDNLLLRAKLSQHPALLSFELGADFHTEGIFSYDGTPSCQVERDQGKKPVYHAMVLIGMRNAGTKYFYLCMNFWRTKFFVELSDEYLARCNGKISTLHVDIPLDELLYFENVPRFNGLSVETAVEMEGAKEDDEEEDDEEEDDEGDDLYY